MDEPEWVESLEVIKILYNLKAFQPGDQIRHKWRGVCVIECVRYSDHSKDEFICLQLNNDARPMCNFNNILAWRRNG